MLAERAERQAHDTLLLSRYGRSLRSGDVLVLVRKAGWRAGLDVHPHQLRRALATHLVARGVSVEAVRVLLGHQRLATTARYLGAERSDLHRAVARLDRVRRSPAVGPRKHT